MTHHERQALAELIRSRRHQLGLSARELARRVGVDNATITLLEQSKIAQPRFTTLRAIAEGLGVPLADIYAVTKWLPEDSLPSLRPYMRAKFQDLPDEAVREIEHMVDRLTRKYGCGPRPGEDEQT